MVKLSELRIRCHQCDTELDKFRYSTTELDYYGICPICYHVTFSDEETVEEDVEPEGID